MVRQRVDGGIPLQSMSHLGDFPLLHPRDPRLIAAVRRLYAMVEDDPVNEQRLERAMNFNFMRRLVSAHAVGRIDLTHERLLGVLRTREENLGAALTYLLRVVPAHDGRLRVRLIDAASTHHPYMMSVMDRIEQWELPVASALAYALAAGAAHAAAYPIPIFGFGNNGIEDDIAFLRAALLFSGQGALGNRLRVLRRLQDAVEGGNGTATQSEAIMAVSGGPWGLRVSPRPGSKGTTSPARKVVLRGSHVKQRLRTLSAMSPVLE
jgi:hypothetical protein